MEMTPQLDWYDQQLSSTFITGDLLTNENFFSDAKNKIIAGIKKVWELFVKFFKWLWEKLKFIGSKLKELYNKFIGTTDKADLDNREITRADTIVDTPSMVKKRDMYREELIKELEVIVEVPMIDITKVCEIIKVLSTKIKMKIENIVNKILSHNDIIITEFEDLNNNLISYFSDPEQKKLVEMLLDDKVVIKKMNLRELFKTRVGIDLGVDGTKEDLAKYSKQIFDENDNKLNLINVEVKSTYSEFTDYSNNKLPKIIDALMKESFDNTEYCEYDDFKSTIMLKFIKGVFPNVQILFFSMTKLISKYTITENFKLHDLNKNMKTKYKAIYSHDSKYDHAILGNLAPADSIEGINIFIADNLIPPEFNNPNIECGITLTEPSSGKPIIIINETCANSSLKMAIIYHEIGHIRNHDVIESRNEILKKYRQNIKSIYDMTSLGMRRADQEIAADEYSARMLGKEPILTFLKKARRVVQNILKTNTDIRAKIIYKTSLVELQKRISILEK